jgi:UDP-GlcNAc:undecaprenyl-phosphate GlcNAc-1-phosphate transferase
MEDYLALLSDYKSYGFIALVVTVFATPLAANLARRFDVMDMPDDGLKPHARATPYLGGAAICLGWAVALTVAIAANPLEIDWRILLPIMIGGIAMSLLGLFDDLWGISPKLRLVIGATIIIIVIYFTSAGQGLGASFCAVTRIHLPPNVEAVLSAVIGLFIVLGACNSTNLIDGLDGLCAGVTAIISLGFFVLAAHLALTEVYRPANATRLVLAIAMFGAAVGFLPLNFNPARIFMGDAGSVLLGFNCGIIILFFEERSVLRWTAGGLMIFALPIFDTALAIVRRWRSGRSIFAGDRSHFYDQLVDRGMSVRKVVIISYALTTFFAVLGCITIWVRLRYCLRIYAVVVVAIVIVVIKSGMARAEPLPAEENTEPQAPPDD